MGKMILNKIKLENIRSYLNQKLEFPEGSLLLSGDIGTGKSSILLAIKFSLFGLSKGTLSGSSLLRNGKNKGSVELDFTIDNKNIIIKRTLKRGAGTVTQDSGYIIIDGNKKEASALELKQKILELLNYPKELLTKSKDLIYRYTVYTPQEEMKAILLSQKDIRLDTLRKVFDIDKYKRIKENSKAFISNLKQKRKELEGRISDLRDKEKEKKERDKEKDSIKKQIDKLLPGLKQINKHILGKNNEVKKAEEDIEKLNQLKKDLEINEVYLKNNLEKRNRNNEELNFLKKTIDDLEEELREGKVKGIEDIKRQIKENKDKIKLIESTLMEVVKKLQSFNIIKENSTKIKKGIGKLDICPVCKQKVGKEHKHLIEKEENRKLKDAEINIKEYSDREKELRNKLEKAKKELEKLNEIESNYNLIKIKLSTLKEKQEQQDRILKEQDAIKKDIGKINVKKQELEKEISKFRKVDYDKLKQELEELREKEKSLEIEKSSLNANLNNVNEIIEKLRKEIEIKLGTKNDLIRISNLQHWLEEHFINLVALIEKQIMLKVHTDFNSLFQKWFNILVATEDIEVNLDDEFSPLIQQNGYDIDYLHLSGGEKTAAALAYRLALNQVINNLMTKIRTRDLLILDEPTDGFSDEQLEKVRDVLNELNVRQLILVSHEPKIESFVENIIKFTKKEHVSQISSY